MFNNEFHEMTEKIKIVMKGGILGIQESIDED